MRHERIVIKSNDKNDLHYLEEKRKAVLALANGDSFIVLVTKDKGGACVSAVSSQDIEAMLYNLKKIHNTLIKSLKKMGELEDEEKDDRSKTN